MMIEKDKELKEAWNSFNDLENQLAEKDQIINKLQYSINIAKIDGGLDMPN